MAPSIGIRAGRLIFRPLASPPLSQCYLEREGWMLRRVLLRRKYGGEMRGQELGARQRRTGAVFTRGKGLRSDSKMTNNSIRLGAQGIRKSQS
jgi:hypothetical protein